jgi:hypothetical protein
MYEYNGFIFNCFAGYSIRVYPLNVVMSFLFLIYKFVISYRTVFIQIIKLLISFFFILLLLLFLNSKSAPQHHARFYVLTVASMKMTALRNMAPCSLVETDRCFIYAYCLHRHGESARRSIPEECRCPQLLRTYVQRKDSKMRERKVTLKERYISTHLTN